MIKKAPGVSAVHDMTIVTWENDDGFTEALVFDVDENDEEVTEFVAALLSENDGNEHLDNDIDNGVDTDTVKVFAAHELGTPKLQSSVTYE